MFGQMKDLAVVMAGFGNDEGVKKEVRKWLTEVGRDYLSGDGIDKNFLNKK